MDLTSKELKARENAIFDGLEQSFPDTFAGKLYRDGVPTPSSYLAQRIRVMLAFREPNLHGNSVAHDMRDEVHDRTFRPLVDGQREDRRVSCWWNSKAGLFAHAIGAAIDNLPPSASFKDFEAVISRHDWNHAVVNRFAYIQIKKVGGRGSCKPDEIREHATKYAATLRAQVDLYQPHLIIGCGVPPASPADLMSVHVLSGGVKEKTSGTGATWWRYLPESRPRALLQLYHPAWRGQRQTLYMDVFESVREVIGKLS